MGNNKNTVILLAVLLILLAVAYPYLSGSSEPTEDATPVGSQEMSAILQQINGVKLDLSLAQNQMLQNLKDLSLPPTNVSVGKSVPFTATAAK